MGKTNSKQQLCYAIETDNGVNVRDIITHNPSFINDYINLDSDFTPLCMAAYYGSMNAAKVLLEVYI